MLRFILLCFGLLAFAFYQMSGGADFDSEKLRLSRIEAPADLNETNPDATATAQLQQPIPADVTRVSLNLTSVDDVLRPTNRRTQAARVIPETEEAVTEEEPVIILPSLITDRVVITPVDFGAADEPAPEPLAATTPDRTAIRSVTGASVNMRGGPGTNYSVIDQLMRGDKVEILQNPGDGWVQLRPIDGDAIGWIAEFLLSDG